MAFDRVPFWPDDGGGGVVVAWSGERLRVEGIETSSAGTVSLRGRFEDADRIRVLEHHRHWPWFRDGASYLGLLALAAYWLRALK